MGGLIPRLTDQASHDIGWPNALVEILDQQSYCLVTHSSPTALQVSALSWEDSFSAGLTKLVLSLNGQRRWPARQFPRFTAQLRQLTALRHLSFLDGGKLQRQFDILVALADAAGGMPRFCSLHLVSEIPAAFCAHECAWQRQHIREHGHRLHTCPLYYVSCLANSWTKNVAPPGICKHIWQPASWLEACPSFAARPLWSRMTCVTAAADAL